MRSQRVSYHLGTEKQQGARDPAVNKTKIPIPFCCCLVSRLCPTLCNSMDCSCQAPLFMGFSSQEYWSGLPFPLPGDLPDPGIEPMSPAWQVGSLSLSHLRSTGRYTRCRFDPWVGKSTWRRKWQPTPIFLTGESHGQRSLVGYSLWGQKESDTTELLSIHIQFCRIYET